MDKKTKEMLVKMAGQPDHLRKDKFIRECRKYNEESNKNTRNNKNNIMNRDNWNNKNNENNKLTTNNETTLRFIMSQFSYISWYVWCVSLFVLIAAIFIIVMKIEATDSITVIAAIIPFVAMAAVMESFRSKYFNVGTGKCHQSFVSGNLLCKNELHRNGTYCNYIMFDYLDWKK